ncbi:MAG TPA: DUF2520 domain-containing protein [Bacteroidales bacterium]|nr:DUF2520 domain-containing protein [Bacteroidales bacterium]
MNSEKIEINSAIIIGAGNVAWHLGHSLLESGIKINAVVNRTESRGRQLANSLGTKYANTIEDTGNVADLIILAVSDDVIANVACSTGFLKSGILVHTAGAVSMNVLSINATDFGVIYPLQTFTAGRKLNFRHIPLLLEASSKNVFESLNKLASRLSDHVMPMTSENRMIVHLAAVLSSNFPNHLFTLSEKILSGHGLSFSLLKPLLEETISKALSNGPAVSQTGPAVRGNEKIIKKHLKLLEKYPEIREVYKILSANIQGQKTALKNNNER